MGKGDVLTLNGGRNLLSAISKLEGGRNTDLRESLNSKGVYRSQSRVKVEIPLKGSKGLNKMKPSSEKKDT